MFSLTHLVASRFFGLNFFVDLQATYILFAFYES